MQTHVGISVQSEFYERTDIQPLFDLKNSNFIRFEWTVWVVIAGKNQSGSGQGEEFNAGFASGRDTTADKQGSGSLRTLGGRTDVPCSMCQAPATSGGLHLNHLKLKIQFLSLTRHISRAQWHMWLEATTLDSRDTEHSRPHRKFYGVGHRSTVREASRSQITRSQCHANNGKWYIQGHTLGKQWSQDSPWISSPDTLANLSMNIVGESHLQDIIIRMSSVSRTNEKMINMAATLLPQWRWQWKGVQLQWILVQGGTINVHVKALAEFLCNGSSIVENQDFGVREEWYIL